MSRTIEVDETQFLANQQLAKTVAEMLKNKDARTLVLKAQKMVQPDAVIPEIDAAEPIQKELDGFRKEITDSISAMRKEREDEVTERKRAALLAKFEEGRNSLKSKGYTDEGVAEVEKLMETKGILDHEDGLTLFEKLHPPAETATPSGINSWNFLDESKSDSSNENMKKLFESKGENESALNSMINSALTDTRNSQRK